MVPSTRSKWFQDTESGLSVETLGGDDSILNLGIRNVIVMTEKVDGLVLVWTNLKNHVANVKVLHLNQYRIRYRYLGLRKNHRLGNSK